MPTKKKRVGFIPRDEVMKIIDKLSLENNLSNSKIISILVEEALSIRGLFNKNTGKVSKSYQLSNNSSELLSEKFNDPEAIDKLTKNINSKNHKNTLKTNLFKQTNKDSFDLQTYKSFLSFLKFQEMMDEYDN